MNYLTKAQQEILISLFDRKTYSFKKSNRELTEYEAGFVFRVVCYDSKNDIMIITREYNDSVSTYQIEVSSKGGYEITYLGFALVETIHIIDKTGGVE